jgi:hypothetical protein
VVIIPQAGAAYVEATLSDGTNAVYVHRGAVQVADDAGRGTCIVRAGQLTVVANDRAPAEPLTYSWSDAQPYFNADASSNEAPFVALALSPKCFCCGHRNPPGAETCAQCGSPLT